MSDLNFHDKQLKGIFGEMEPIVCCRKDKPCEKHLMTQPSETRHTRVPGQQECVIGCEGCASDRAEQEDFGKDIDTLSTMRMEARPLRTPATQGGQPPQDSDASAGWNAETLTDAIWKRLYHDGAYEDIRKLVTEFLKTGAPLLTAEQDSGEHQAEVAPKEVFTHKESAAAPAALPQAIARKILMNCSYKYQHPLEFDREHPQSVVDQQLHNAAEIVATALAPLLGKLETLDGAMKEIAELDGEKYTCIADAVDTATDFKERAEKAEAALAPLVAERDALRDELEPFVRDSRRVFQDKQEWIVTCIYCGAQGTSPDVQGSDTAPIQHEESCSIPKTEEVLKNSLTGAARQGKEA